MPEKENKPEKLPRIVAGALADAFGKDFLTIDRWAANGDDVLTSDKAKEVFEKLAFVYDRELYMKKELIKAE